MRNTIVVNGTRIEVEGGGPMSIIGGKVIVGGVTVAEGLSGIVEVKWEGPAANVRADCSLTVNGDVAGDAEAGNSMTVSGSVKGNVRAGNSVNCGDVGGSVKAGNSVYRR